MTYNSGQEVRNELSDNDLQSKKELEKPLKTEEKKIEEIGMSGKSVEEIERAKAYFWAHLEEAGKKLLFYYSQNPLREDERFVIRETIMVGIKSIERD